MTTTLTKVWLRSDDSAHKGSPGVVTKVFLSGPAGPKGDAGTVIGTYVVDFAGRSGPVTPQSSDYATFYEPAGAATAARNAAEGYADAAVGVETTRAEAAEALKADLTAVLARAQNLADLLDVALARTHLGLGDIVTHSITDFVTPAQLNIAIANLIDGAPGALDTIGELVARVLSDETGTAASIAAKADNAAVVHNTGTETIAGAKTFSTAPVVPDGSFAQVKVAGLVAALTDLATAITTAQTNAQGYSDRYAGSAAGTVGRPLAATDLSVTNARTPTAHASTHATGGTDAITPANIGAATAAQGAKADSADQAGFVVADKTRLANTSGNNSGDQDLSGLIVKSIGTTKGDQIGFTGSGAPVRHAIGADGSVQTADSTQADGWRWGALPTPPLYSDGSDGDVVISVNTTLTRPMYYNNLTINAGITLTAGQFPIYVRGTLITGVGAAIHGDGAASASNAGGTFGTAGLLSRGANGPNAVAGAGVAGTTVAGTFFQYGGAGGASGSGGGGAGAAGGGKNATPANWFTGTRPVSPLAMHGILQGVIAGASLSTTIIGGGASGAAGAGDGTVIGTGGGSGGNVVAIAARNVVNNGAIRAAGGAGAPGSVRGGSNIGGGGGGGGGCVIVICDTFAGNAPTAPGGAGGAGRGTGTAGSDGSAGSVFLIRGDV